MKETNKDNLILENYKTEFSYEANKSNLNISFNRVAFVFFIFLIIFSIYSIKIFYLGSLNWKQQKNANQIQNNFRADIVDNNGNFIAKTVNTLIVGIHPNLIIDEKKLFINLPSESIILLIIIGFKYVPKLATAEYAEIISIGLTSEDPKAIDGTGFISVVNLKF